MTEDTRVEATPDGDDRTYEAPEVTVLGSVGQLTSEGDSTEPTK